MGKMKALCLIICCVNLVSFAQSQNTSYWQQHVDYVISVSLNDVEHSLTGNITMSYTNNSPDELTFIYMHLWPNAYKNNSTAFARQQLGNKNTDFQFAKDSERGYIDSIDFKVDGQTTKWEYKGDSIDIAKMYLNEPLLPGKTITITTPFHVKLPASFSRGGHVKQQYQITQWYPKPAVYDRFGWHPIPYLDQGEFYSEYGNYDVLITLPKNYVVGASGNLQNANEIQWLANKAEKDLTAPYDSKDLSFPASSDTLKTLEYKIENAHDFAWFADKRYHVLKGEVTLPLSQRKVTTYTYFTNLEGELWRKSIEYVNRSVLFYSDQVGEYQYDVAQAVDGALSAGGGMEYPTITVIGQSGDDETLDNVITHEVGHNWFYGMLGSNERDHGWMDEGINSYYEAKYMDTYYGGHSAAGITVESLGILGKFLGVEDKTTDELGWSIREAFDKTNIGQAEDIVSTEFTPINYGLVMYVGTAYKLDYLAAYLTQPVFDKIMHKYFSNYLFKHVYPDDIKKVFEEETGENFSWFFDELLKTDHDLDYKISGIQQGKTAIAVDVTNNTSIVAPFCISLMDDDSILHTDWYRGHTGKQTIYLNKSNYKDITSVTIDAQHVMPELNRENNTIKLSGLLKRNEPLQVRAFPFGIDDPTKTTIYTTPIIGYNSNDGFMLGLGVWNSTIPAPLIEYVLAPMYAFNSKALAGQGSVGLNIYPQKGFFSRMRLSENVYTYGDGETASIVVFSESKNAVNRYTKLETKLELDIRKNTLRSPLQQKISVRNVSINQTDNYIFYGDILPIEPIIVKQHTKYLYNEIRYDLINKRVLFPYSFSAIAQQNDDFFKLAGEFNYKINYPRSKKGIDVRLYAGSAFDQTHVLSLTNIRETSDYMHDNIYLNPEGSEGLFSHQVYERDANFKVPLYANTASSKILAANFEVPIPKSFIAAFADFAYTFDNTDNSATAFNYDAGIMIRMPNNLFEVYFPLFMSSYLKEQFPDNSKYGDKITFMINLNALNIFDRMRTLDY